MILWTLVAVAGAVLLGAGIWVVYSHTARVTVPDLVGTNYGSAASVLRRDGLAISVGGRRFSARPKGEILKQTPGKGAQLARGDSVAVVVSAGTEDFAMPDIVGDGLALAKGTLESRGLQVRVQLQPSQQPSETVLSSNPAPGTSVRTGDIVSVVVSAKSTSGNVLLPFDMSRLVVVVDAAPVGTGQTDAPDNVARRLRSLIEASGGRVVVTRSATDTRSASVQARATKASEGTCTVAIGLGVASGSPGGIVLFSPGVGATTAESAKVATAVSTELAATTLQSRQATSSVDPVFKSVRAPWVRVILGSVDSREDAGNFRDPRWSDTIARDIYRAIGAGFAVKGGT
jgi:N-acetylmuramoyl-L-alanine amidase